MNINGFALLAVVAGLAFVALVVFIILREFWTWYWKQSEQVVLLKSIDASLKTLAERGPPAPAAPATTARPGWVSVPPSMIPARP